MVARKSDLTKWQQRLPELSAAELPLAQAAYAALAAKLPA
jgi:hypothetical protein